MKNLICGNELRREAVRQQPKLYGLDFLEVGPDQRTLTVHFLGKAPRGHHGLDRRNVVIEGGRRIRDIQVISADVHRSGDPELDDTIVVVVDRAGDFSTYTLRIVARDPHGHPLPHPDFDPHYSSVAFSFKVDCPSDLDCLTPQQCPPMVRSQPEINYLAKDYASFRQLILDRLALIMPDWQERHVPDLGIVLVELLAYVGDYLSYYQDAVATEAYLDTARLRISVRRHARLVDYQMHEGCNARAWVTLMVNDYLELDPKGLYFVTVPGGATDAALTEEELLKQAAPGYKVFEPMTQETIKLYESHYEIHFYTWGDNGCCLDIGATTATLIGKLAADNPDPNYPDNADDSSKQQTANAKPPAPSSKDGDVPTLYLKTGDVLIFEEKIGPKTGNPADADSKHRHAVRLTRVEAAMDPLNGTPIVEIWWADEDALPFPLCISTVGPPSKECAILTNVSVARGNVVLVDHGQTIDEPAGSVPVDTTVERCDCEGILADVSLIAGLYRPTLKASPVTFSQPLPANVPAAGTLIQDPRMAVPQIWPTSDPAPAGDPRWVAQRDLLGSTELDQHFVAEIDDDGRAHLRFGDGELGREPDAGMTFDVVYRTGNGSSGNVGAEAITTIVFRKLKLSGGIAKARNPLPASGGTQPEPVSEVKLFAPHAFRQELQRAVIADDYAALVERDFSKVQRAAATLRWNGSWYEALVAVDEEGEEQAEQTLLNQIRRRLYRYRRIGHDVDVESARLVPLLIELQVCVLPHYLRGHIEAELLDLFSNRVLPEGSKGFFHPDNLSFGEGIYLSRLVALAQGVEGVESVEVLKLERFGEGPNHEIDNGVLPLGPLEIAQVDNDPSFPENGRFILDVGGGR
jgi:hypothetical protein